MTFDAPTRLAKGLAHLARLIAVLVLPTACRFEQDLGESLHPSDAVAGDLGRGDDATDAAESPIDAATDMALDLSPSMDGPGTCAPGRIFCTPECIDSTRLAR